MSETDATIHVVLSTDRHYLPHAAAVIASIFANMSPTDHVVIHVMHAELSDVDQARLRRIQSLNSLTKQILFHQIDLQAFAQMPEVKHLSKASYFRLKMQDILTGLTRVIYLDVDMLVRHSLADLWKMDLQDCPIGVVEDADSFAMIYDQMGMNPGTRFNAGMMLCDLDAMRRMPLWDLYMKALEQFCGRLQAGDQDLLNQVFAGQIMIIPCRWNSTTSVYREIVSYSQYDQQQVLEAIADPAIVHFTGRRKPWQIKSDRHRYAMEYWHYLAMTPWRTRCWRKWVKLLLKGRKDDAMTTYAQLRDQLP